MKQSLFEITRNEALSENVMLMTLCGDTSEITRPGQFVNIMLDGLFLRRPISVFRRDGGSFSIIYKTVGKGTEKLAQLKSGKLDILTGLGNGYDTSLSGSSPLLIGGGVGVPPLYYLAETLVSEGKKPSVILGFNSEKEIFCEDDFRRLTDSVYVTTVDGSYGIKGFVTDALKHINYTYFYTCGPEPMLKAVYKATDKSGQFSFEERMGCGFGACMGCSCRTVTAYKRICKDGPVLQKEEILWKE